MCWYFVSCIVFSNLHKDKEKYEQWVNHLFVWHVKPFKCKNRSWDLLVWSFNCSVFCWFFFPVLKCSKVASILLECSNALVSNDKMAYKGLKKQDKFTLSSTFNELFWVYHFIDGPFLQTEKVFKERGYSKLFITLYTKSYGVLFFLREKNWRSFYMLHLYHWHYTFT